ncbi:DUF3310 domain-containing protein [Staphylococcus hominis]|uniref:DUF3310 domain-containing protein n=2 Tax=Staphylococcus hominis TaxID=1290 RepID=UPI00204C1DA7|nr:DUF3310 domain-containing protein [Staphylococcus hominis]MDH9921956.1 DUF3310 domain-containing protein [Staphylococcus hominis]MDH9924093.1 DUF3310 domain-containing protein [Staphylococcus hominis]MDH9949649.1 DUF3310 domain-containing protein [Staphylococcus hominis]DAI83757.1 MAG TPA: nucelotide kinase [Caudoviricetes sp.]
MENVRVVELNKDDIVQFQCANKKFSAFQTAIVNQVYAEEKRLKTVWKAEVENQAGRTFTITDNDDFIRVNVPFTRKVNLKQEEQDMVHEPPHYQFGKFSARMIIELVGKTYKSASVFYHVGNALKYLMRAPRKNGLQDLKKAKQSVEFAIENWEAEENGI